MSNVYEDTYDREVAAAGRAGEAQGRIRGKRKAQASGQAWGRWSLS